MIETAFVSSRSSIRTIYPCAQRLYTMRIATFLCMYDTIKPVLGQCKQSRWYINVRTSEIWLRTEGHNEEIPTLAAHHIGPSCTKTSATYRSSHHGLIVASRCSSVWSSHSQTHRQSSQSKIQYPSLHTGLATSLSLRTHCGPVLCGQLTNGSTMERICLSWQPCYSTSPPTFT